MTHSVTVGASSCAGAGRALAAELPAASAASVPKDGDSAGVYEDPRTRSEGLNLLSAIQV